MQDKSDLEAVEAVELYSQKQEQKRTNTIVLMEQVD